jgi:hypothetical protein
VGSAARAAVASEAADAEASSLEAAEVVAAEAAEVAGELAWYGHLCGPGAAGESLPLRLRCLQSRRSNQHRRRGLSHKVMGISSPHEPNNVLRLRTRLSFAK